MIKIEADTGIVGWCGIGLFAIVYDVIVMKKGKQSLSGAIWSGTTHPYYGPAIAGTWAALTWHLFIDRQHTIRSKND